MEELLFIVPARNEEAAIGDVVAELRENFPEATVLVVSDGSADATAERARQSGALVLELPFNLGIGGAVQTGFLFGARHQAEIAIQFDGDGQHCASEVGKLLSPIRDGSADVVIGSRFLADRHYDSPLPRRAGMIAFSLVNSLLMGKRMTDCTSGFRAYRRRAIERLSRDYPHDYPEPESMVTLARAGFRVVEVPVEMRQRRGGESSITFSRSIYYMCKVLLAITIGSTRRTKGVKV